MSTGGWVMSTNSLVLSENQTIKFDTQHDLFTSPLPLEATLEAGGQRLEAG